MAWRVASVDLFGGFGVTRVCFDDIASFFLRRRQLNFTLKCRDDVAGRGGAG